MLKTEIRTASDLRDFHEEYNSDSQYFTRETMKFFGDTMRNYGVRKTTIETYAGRIADVWELFRRSPVKYGVKESSYFDVDNFKILFAANEV